VPRTDVLGAVRTVATGPAGQLPLNGIVGGLATLSSLAAPRAEAATGGRRRGAAARAGARADGVPDRIATGDVVALQLPDAHIDTADERPKVSVKGRARLVMLAAHGVIHDDDAIDAEVPVPIGTVLVGLQADGDADALDGYSGWHDRSRMGMLADRAGIGAGCTVIVDGDGSNVGLGWATGGSLSLGATEVHTRFSRTMRTIAIALTGVAPRSLNPTEIHVIGARLGRDGSGDDKPPVVVTIGTTSVLVYGIVPDRDATSVTVSITPGADWVVSGVLGAGGPNEEPVAPAQMAEQIARNGLAAVAAKLTVMQGPGCSVDWIAPAPAPPPRAVARKRPAKKTPPKKAAAKKAPANKTVAKAASRRQS
jgi:hypothetical protein